MEASSERCQPAILDRAKNRDARRMVRALAATGAVVTAFLVVAPAQADPARHHHNYYKLNAAGLHR
jgi:hypothetical protein